MLLDCACVGCPDNQIGVCIDGDPTCSCDLLNSFYCGGVTPGFCEHHTLACDANPARVAPNLARTSLARCLRFICCPWRTLPPTLNLTLRHVLLCLAGGYATCFAASSTVIVRSAASPSVERRLMVDLEVGDTVMVRHTARAHEQPARHSQSLPINRLHEALATSMASACSGSPCCRISCTVLRLSDSHKLS